MKKNRLQSTIFYRRIMVENKLKAYRPHKFTEIKEHGKMSRALKDHLSKPKLAVSYGLGFISYLPKGFSLALINTYFLIQFTRQRLFMQVHFMPFHVALFVFAIFLLLCNIPQHLARMNNCADLFIDLYLDAMPPKLMTPKRFFLLFCLVMSLASTALLSITAVYKLQGILKEFKILPNLSHPAFVTIALFLVVGSIFSSFCFNYRDFEEKMTDFFKDLREGNEKFYVLFTLFLVSSSLMTFYMTKSGLDSLNHHHHFLSPCWVMILAILFTLFGTLSSMASQTGSISRYLLGKENPDLNTFESQASPCMKSWLKLMKGGDITLYGVIMSLGVAIQLPAVMGIKGHGLPLIALQGLFWALLMIINSATCALFTWNDRIIPMIVESQYESDDSLNTLNNIDFR